MVSWRSKENIKSNDNFYQQCIAIKKISLEMMLAEIV
jgi:hypothetical protein